MRRIQKVAVLGSGLMGSGISCHLANVGFEVLMLDMVPRDLTEDQKDIKEFRNSLADKSLKQALKGKPAPLYKTSFAKRITTGNFEDDLGKISEYDWVIEVIIERLDIKKDLFEKVDRYRKKGSLVSSNTSGIPIHMIAEGRSEDFKKHFLGTHFFNPPRYLKLLEIIPTAHTDKRVVDFFMEFGEKYLGKDTVLCKDTPAFIGNRVGVTSMAKVFELTSELGLSLGEVDKLTGPAMARPKTGTFRLADLVGLDTAVMVLKDLKQRCTDDDALQQMQIPDFLEYLVDNKYLGNKSGQGFYKKTDRKSDSGKTIIEELDLREKEYTEADSSSLESLKVSKQIEDPEKRLRALWKVEDKGGELIRKSLAFSFLYSANRIPEISDQIFGIDQAMKAGFAWSYGPFEYADIIGLDKMIKVGTSIGLDVPEWLESFMSKGHTNFYKLEESNVLYYNHQSESYEQVPGTKEQIKVAYFKDKEPVFENSELTLHDIGEGVLLLEFTSKSNSIGEGILKGIGECITIAEEEDWKGIIIANDGKNFTVGANLMLIGSMAYQQDFDELNQAVKLFQDTSMKIRYSKIPVVAATQGYVFGGGCEFVMHTDSTIAAAESYIGLVEVGVGIIPGGGGTKEFALRSYEEYKDTDVENGILLERFKNIAMGNVSTSAHGAFDYGYLSTKDQVVINSSYRITEAKKKVLELAENYIAPIPRRDIKVLGRSGIATLELAINELRLGKYASEHDAKIAKKIAYVMSGGDLTGMQEVSEKYLLELEREAFLSLCTEQKTLERIQHMLETGKPLRN
ncbi:3-hydroxyacyl-CoA dehydrogenase/enoyl-CoA hydratase family protein [Membranihabitans maritimus]|uniref:3-hydroxyacyl-CoA dehydrogenase/enoyl-CoA hydratase family protein n=1 Tax=Membranihabitans maritimus TaxID=2904244 RepID=UPI001F3B3B3C|nr:3-hydroxyacyl-CoA dehydrogenase/enoyl-CoA hydratase family protein [Membranihabitans maritimus]